jgi:hypothetical protein
MIATASFVLVGAVWGAEKIVFPTTGFPLSLATRAETIYLFNKEAIGILNKCYAFFLHSIIMPKIGNAYGFRLSVQRATPGTDGLLAGVGIVMWILLLALGCWSCARLKKSRTCAIVLLTIAGQFVLAMVFGVETFFYSAHWGSILVLLCALSALTIARGFVVALAAGLILVAGLNNFQKFNIAAASLKDRYQEERRFTARIAALTTPDSLIVCGQHAAAAQGEPTHALGWDPWTAPVGDIGLIADPDTCYFRFDDLEVNRKGWIIPYEDWSMDLIDILRQRGAKYFITPYRYGLEHNRALFEAMDKRFKKLERTDGWAFYDVSVGRTVK